MLFILLKPSFRNKIQWQVALLSLGTRDSGPLDAQALRVLCSVWLPNRVWTPRSSLGSPPRFPHQKTEGTSLGSLVKVNTGLEAGWGLRGHCPHTHSGVTWLLLRASCVTFLLYRTPREVVDLFRRFYMSYLGIFQQGLE